MVSNTQPLMIPFLFTVCVCLWSCQQKKETVKEANKDLASLFENYYQENLQLFPFFATVNGDNRYNDKMYVDFTDSYRAKVKAAYQHYLDDLKKFDRETLIDEDKVSYDDFKREMEINIEGFSFHDNYMPLNQFSSMHLIFAQFGSGSVVQPFKTVKDYDDWLKRASVFAEYADSAVVYCVRAKTENRVRPPIYPRRDPHQSRRGQRAVFQELQRRAAASITPRSWRATPRRFSRISPRAKTIMAQVAKPRS